MKRGWMRIRTVCRIQEVQLYDSMGIEMRQLGLDTTLAKLVSSIHENYRPQDISPSQLE